MLNIMDHNINNMEHDPFDNIWKYIIFGFIYVFIFIIITMICVEYDSVIDACDISNYKNQDYTYAVANCNKAKNDYITRDINRFYAIFFVGLFSILIGMYISKLQSDEKNKTIGRSLVAGGLGLIAFFITCDKNIVSINFRKYISAFTLGITWGFIFFLLLDFELI